MGLAIDLEGIVPDGAEIPIGAVFSRAIARVGLRGGAHGRDLLRMAAAMAPAPFSAVFFERVLDTLGAPSASRDAELSCVSSVKQCLAATADQRWKNLTVHPLTSRAVRFAEEDPARDALVEAAAVSALLAMLPRRYDPSAYSAVEFEIVHARELVRRATTVAQTELMGRVARYDLVRGAYASGAELYRTQLDTYRRLYGDAHPDTVTAMSNLAGARFVTGDFRGAQRLHEEVVRARRRDPGDEHQDTLTAMSNLAATLSIVGDLAAARELQEEMLTIRHRVFGQDDPKTTGSAWNLFLTLNEIEDRSAAESVFSEHLSWLLDREPASLANEQRRIRDAVADVAVRNRALSNRSWGAARRNV